MITRNRRDRGGPVFTTLNGDGDMVILGKSAGASQVMLGRNEQRGGKPLVAHDALRIAQVLPGGQGVSLDEDAVVGDAALGGQLGHDLALDVAVVGGPAGEDDRLDALFAHGLDRGPHPTLQTFRSDSIVFGRTAKRDRDVGLRRGRLL